MGDDLSSYRKERVYSIFYCFEQRRHVGSTTSKQHLARYSNMKYCYIIVISLNPINHQWFCVVVLLSNDARHIICRQLCSGSSSVRILCLSAEFFKNSIGPTRIINRSINRPQLISHDVPMTYSPSHKNTAQYLVNQPV